MLAEQSKGGHLVAAYRKWLGLASDPICESNDLKNAGDPVAAKQVLMELCQADLRCLDAHAHLGNFVFDDWTEEAIRYYEAGMRFLIDEVRARTAWEGREVVERVRQWVCKNEMRMTVGRSNRRRQWRQDETIRFRRENSHTRGRAHRAHER